MNFLLVVILLPLQIYFVSGARVPILISKDPQCFVEGICTDSLSIGISITPDQYECLNKCKDDDQCAWFTFSSEFQTCQLFSECNTFDTEQCQLCISGEKECSIPEPSCWIPGECEGNAMAPERAKTPNECLQLCKAESRCVWFTFLANTNACFLFTYFKTIDKSCTVCVSGEKRCNEDLETSTTSTTTADTTTVDTTTTSADITSTTFTTADTTTTAADTTTTAAETTTTTADTTTTTADTTTAADTTTTAADTTTTAADTTTVTTSTTTTEESTTTTADTTTTTAADTTTTAADTTTVTTSTTTTEESITTTTTADTTTTEESITTTTTADTTTTAADTTTIKTTITTTTEDTTTEESTTTTADTTTTAADTTTVTTSTTTTADTTTTAADTTTVTTSTTTTEESTTTTTTADTTTIKTTTTTEDTTTEESTTTADTITTAADTTITTTTADTITTTADTTTMLPIVYSKVLVALGDKGTLLDDVEIVDLLSPETTCQNISNFPIVNRHAIGELGFNDKPLICGGDNFRSTCYEYQNPSWVKFVSLSQGRFASSLTKSPFQDGGSKLFVSGGYDTTYLSSTEVLTENGWQISVPLPVTMHDHCMVTFNLTSVIVIGGYQNGRQSRRTFIFNSESLIWSEGPSLMKARHFHKCGTIRQSSQTQENSIIVVGGNDRVSYLSSVEVLDLDSNAWRTGPDLPFGIFRAAMVADPSGGVVLIGGIGNDMYLDTLFRLPHAGQDTTWELMPQKLKTARFDHVALLVPDDISLCKNF